MKLSDLNKHFVDVPEASEIYGCSQQYILELIKDKKLASIKKGGHNILLRVHVERLKRERGKERKANGEP